MSATVNIEGLSKAAVLAALYNASKPLGWGKFDYDPAPMTEVEARRALSTSTYIDYLKGRVMKVDLAGEKEFSSGLYDRDNGAGAAQRAVDALRGGKGL